MVGILFSGDSAGKTIRRKATLRLCVFYVFSVLCGSFFLNQGDPETQRCTGVRYKKNLTTRNSKIYIKVTTKPLGAPVVSTNCELKGPPPVRDTLNPIASPPPAGDNARAT